MSFVEQPRQYDESVKHLNPRQGITTQAHPDDFSFHRASCETPKSPPGDYNMMSPGCGKPVPFILSCETPKSPPGDYNPAGGAGSRTIPFFCVKHLNPRQGITTRRFAPLPPWGVIRSVKHLNPRQGITTPWFPPFAWGAGRWCETPKSLPGDYNAAGGAG